MNLKMCGLKRYLKSKKKSIKSSLTVFMVVLFLGLFFTGGSLFAEQFFVAPYGSDNNPGTKTRPFATFSKVRDVIWIELDGSGDITVYFREGIYYFDRTIVLSIQHTGTENQIITFRNYPGENPVFTSGVNIRGWRKLRSSDLGYRYIPQRVRNRVFVADVSVELNKTGNFTYLFDRNTDWIPRATTEAFHNISLVPLEEWSNNEDIEIRVVNNETTTRLYSVDSLNIVGNRIYTYPLKSNLLFDGSEDITVYVENSLSGLDERGEWVLNRKEKKLYLWPESDTGGIYAPCLEELIRLEGNSDYVGKSHKPVSYIDFKGITFTGSDRDLVRGYGITDFEKGESNKSTLLRFRHAENCSVDSCTFEKSGNDGISFEHYSQFNTVRNCVFRNLGGSAIKIQGYRKSERDFSKNHIITHNNISSCGFIEWSAPAIEIISSGYNRIAFNNISELPAGAISLSTPLVSSKAAAGSSMETSTLTEEAEILSLGYNYLNGNVVEYNTIDRVFKRLNGGGSISIEGTGTGINYGSPNTIQYNYFSDIIRGDAIILTGVNAEYVNIQNNIITNSSTPYGILTRSNNISVVSNIFYDFKPDQFFLWDSEINHFVGNLRIEGNSTEYIQSSQCADEYRQIVKILNSRIYPTNTWGLEVIKRELSDIINRMPD